MDIRHRLSETDCETLSRAFAAEGRQDGLVLTVGFVGAVGLLAAFPLAATPEGVARMLYGVLFALTGALAAYGAARGWTRLRARFTPPAPVMGLEPGERMLSLSLGSLREIGPPGERVFRWAGFLGEVETERHLALRLSSRECVAIPKAALATGPLKDAAGLKALIARAGGMTG